MADPSSLATRPRTKSQIKASEAAEREAVKAKWKTLVPAAQTLWPKVPQENLLGVEGNFHRLAGLVQLRYGLSREESDQQVRQFLEAHFTLTGTTLRLT